ncbi:hypothetical protein JCM10212_002526 [Sporobolomyces blumeae]
MTTQSGLDQLLTLKATLDDLVQAYSESDRSRHLRPLAAQGLAGPPVPDAALMRMSATLVQMQALVEGPMWTLSNGFKYHLPSALRVAIETHVEEQLREAEKPLSATDLAKPTGTDPDKLARCLRLLAANHIFVEVEPGVFDRNLCSSVLDKRMKVDDMVKTPDDMYSSGGGIAALISHCADEAMKSSAHIPEALVRGQSASSAKKDATPWQLAFGCEGDPFTFFAQPGNEWRVKRFASAMAAARLGFSPDIGTSSRPRRTDGAKVVDVGGGVGHLTLILAEAIPSLKFVVQDRREVIEKDAPHFWETSTTPDVRSRVEVVPHDFFTPNPIKGADVYFMRAIVHDWPDAEAIKILSHLAEAASSSSRLVVVETTYESLSPQAPPMTSMPYYLDIQMMLFDARERTEEQYAELGRKAGWELVKTWKTGPEGKDAMWRHYEFAKAEK